MNTRFQEAGSGSRSQLRGLSAEKHKLLRRPNQELSTTQNNWELVYWRQLHNQREKNHHPTNRSLNWFQMFFRPNYLMHWKAIYLHQICPHVMCSSLEQSTLNLQEKKLHFSQHVKISRRICANKLQSLQDQIYHRNGSKIMKYHLYELLNT